MTNPWRTRGSPSDRPSNSSVAPRYNIASHFPNQDEDDWVTAYFDSLKSSPRPTIGTTRSDIANNNHGVQVAARNYIAIDEDSITAIGAEVATQDAPLFENVEARVAGASSRQNDVAGGIGISKLRSAHLSSDKPRSALFGFGVPHFEEEPKDLQSTDQATIAISTHLGDANLPEVNIEFLQPCDPCGIVDPNNAFCNACKTVFCATCWMRQFLHKRPTRGSVPHERTDMLVARTVLDVLKTTISPELQELSHEEDEDAAWFGVVRDDGEPPSFQDYGRYANLIASTGKVFKRESFLPYSSDLSSGPRHDRRFPSLISFVGQTGAGKSSLIKLLIDLHPAGNLKSATPVVGGIVQDVPTSDDVHLYLDPQTAKSETPLLYADCEGLEGGEREPISAKFKKKTRQKRPVFRDDFTGFMQKPRYTSKRELSWADSAAMKSREFAVTHLYPRLLYTFSDVVVFVLKNPRCEVKAQIGRKCLADHFSVIESVLEKLVDWAAAAIETSSNQPVLPHAIIALNATPNEIDETLWNVDAATSHILESLSRTIYYNRTFKKYAQFWRERDRIIETVEHLILSYYSSIQIIHIPTGDRPKLVEQQISKLYNAIRNTCRLARERKSTLRMLLDVEELQPYLQYAFDHFAKTLDSPFDFVQASFSNSPIPPDFGGNILKLAIDMAETNSNLKATEIFNRLSLMVASCVMLNSARNKFRGPAEQILPQYVDHIDAALDDFCYRHWACEYTKPGTELRCVNVRSGHSPKGHQGASGKILAVGEYISSFSYDVERKEFFLSIYQHLQILLSLLHTRIMSGQAEALAAAEIHRDKVLTSFFEENEPNWPSRTGNDRKVLVNHTACYVCLFDPPEHALPCGHVLCAACVRSYAGTWGETILEMHECPIENRMRQWQGSWRIFLKPDSAGVRILSLDGGGIRGIVELAVLEQIEHALNDKLPIQNFFDLIIGTSTGGLIALGLGAHNWSVKECTRNFEDMCKQAFTRRMGGDIPMVGWLIDHHNHSKYRTGPLQEALMDAFSEEQNLFGGRVSSTSASRWAGTKVAVTTTSAAGRSIVLANYNRVCHEIIPYHFQRPEKPTSELKIWEAARATSAAPRIFKPFHHEPTKQVYMDGAIYHNNPVQIADKEWKLIWPSLREQYPDILLSIGTSYNPKSKPTLGKGLRSPRLGIPSHFSSLLKIAQDHIASSLDSEKSWNTYLSILDPPTEQKSRFVRLNPRLSDDPPRLDEVNSLASLQKIVRAQVSKDPKIDTLAMQLVSSSFYFKRSRPELANLSPGSLNMEGTFLCRFPDNSPEVRELGKFLKEKTSNGLDPYIFIREERAAASAGSKIILDKTIIDRMIRKFQFSIGNVHFRLSKEQAKTEMFLIVNNSQKHPISGFPRYLLREHINRHEDGSSRISIVGPSNTDSQSLRQGSQGLFSRNSRAFFSQIIKENTLRPSLVPGGSRTDVGNISAAHLDRTHALNSVINPFSKLSLLDSLAPSKPPTDLMDGKVYYELPDTPLRQKHVMPSARKPLQEETRQNLLNLIIKDAPQRWVYQ